MSNPEYEEKTRIHKEREEFWYDNHEIEVQMDWNEPTQIQEVKLDGFTSDEWVDMFQKEGELLPACCADISRIRDIIINTLRNDFWIRAEDLYEAAELIRGHGFDEEHPLWEVVKLWEIIKDDANLDNRTMSADLNTAEGAISALATGASTLDFLRFFGSGSKRKSPYESTLQVDAHYMKQLGLLLAAVHTLYHKGKDLALPEVVGYALVRDNEIAETRSGLALYLSPEDCKKVNKGLFKEENVYTIKKVKISLENGVEFLEE